MQIETNPENIPFASYGVFEPQDMTDAEWREYDQFLADEMAAWDAAQEDAEWEFFADAEPPF